MRAIKHRDESRCASQIGHAKFRLIAHVRNWPLHFANRRPIIFEAPRRRARTRKSYGRAGERAAAITAGGRARIIIRPDAAAAPTHPPKALGRTTAYFIRADKAAERAARNWSIDVSAARANTRDCPYFLARPLPRPRPAGSFYFGSGRVSASPCPRLSPEREVRAFLDGLTPTGSINSDAVVPSLIHTGGPDGSVSGHAVQLSFELATRTAVHFTRA